MDDKSKHYVTVHGVPIGCSKDHLLHHMQSHVARSRISGIQQLNCGIESDHSVRWIVRLQTQEEVNYLCDDIKAFDIVVEGECHKITYSRPLQWQYPAEWEQKSSNTTEQFPSDLTFNDPQIGKQMTTRTHTQDTRAKRWIGPLGMQSGFYANLESSAQIPLDQNVQVKMQAQHISSSPDFMSNQVVHSFQNQRFPIPDSQREHYYKSPETHKDYTYQIPPPRFHANNPPPAARVNQKNQLPGRNDHQQAIRFEPAIPLPNQDYKYMHQFGPHNFPLASQSNPNYQYPQYPNMRRPPPIQVPQQYQIRPNIPSQAMGIHSPQGYDNNYQREPVYRPPYTPNPRYVTRLPRDSQPSYNGRAQDNDDSIKSEINYIDDHLAKRNKNKTDCKEENNTAETQVSSQDGITDDCDDSKIEKTRKIIVRNIPSKAEEDFLQLFFENKKKYGGGDVQHIELDCKTRSAIVEFGDAESVDRVLSKRPIVMMEETIEVEAYMSEPEEPVELCTIEVTGPSSIICEENIETLEMYFDSTKWSGGEDVIDCRFCPDKGVFLITFESEEVARRVVNRNNHLIRGVTLSVSLHNPESNSAKLIQEEKSSEMDDIHDVISTVKVSGLKEFSSRESVELYFENARRSDGGEIKEIKEDEKDSDNMYITFAEGEVAKRVSEKTHTVEGKHLQVSLFQLPKPPPVYDDRIILLGLKRSTTQDCLFNFLEAKSRGIPSQLIYHAEQEDVAMVIFQDKPDMNKLEEALKLNKLEDSFLKMSRAPISNCIMVTNLPKEISKDDIEFYFENARRSGGGSVDKVIMNYDDETCFVIFKDFRVIERVLQKKHKISDHTVQVQRYQHCIKRPEGEINETKLRIPDPITVKDCDVYKIKFLKYLAASKQTLEQQLKDSFTSIKMTEDTEDIILMCTLTKSVKHCHKLAKEWPQKAKQNLSAFMESIALYKTTVLQDIWEKTTAEIWNITISNPEAVAVFQDRKECSINVVGSPDCAKEVSNRVEDITKQIAAKLEEERQTIEEVITTLNPIDTKLLLADKFPRKIEEKFIGLKVKINLDHNQIVFKGQAAKVTEAKLKMYEMKNAFGYRKKAGLQMITSELLLEKETKQHIVRKLKAGNITAVWEVGNGLLHVCCTSENQSNERLSIIENSVLENLIGLKKESLLVINSELWQTRIMEIHQMYPGRCRVRVSDDKQRVHVCGTDDIFFTILDTVKKFIRLNTVHEIKVPCDKIVSHLIERHYKDDIAKIAIDLQNFHVQITFLEALRCFEICGTEDGIEEAKKKLLGLLSKVKRREHEIDKPGLGKHMQTAKGKEILNTIENTVKCVITVKTTNEEEEEWEYNPYRNFPVNSSVSKNISVTNIVARCKVFNSRNIFVMKRDITDLKVDVLVNPADDSLTLSGGLARGIVSKGGETIRNECAEFIKREGRLEEGEVFVSSAGNLNSQHIVHVRGPLWRGGIQKEEEMLKDSVSKCLQQATVKNATSVAIPAICCGSLGFPIKCEANAIVKAVKNFFLEGQDSPIIDVYLCDIKDSTVEAFINALCLEEGESNVQRLSTKSGSAPEVPKSMPPKLSMKSQEKVNVSQINKVHVGNVTVSLIHGAIAKQQVNVIVNTIANNLDMKKGKVSASLLQAAGPDLQQELQTKYPNGLKDSEFAITSGQKLKCSMIIHCTLGNWDKQNTDGSKQALRKLMADCLAEAEKNKFVSIAFPAVGTGNLGFPRDVVATEMFSNVSAFAAASLKEVQFIVYDKDTPTIKEFEAELTKWQSEKRVGSRQERIYNPYDDLRLGSRQDSGDITVEDDHIYEELRSSEGEDDEEEDDNDNSAYDDSDDEGYEIGNINIKIQQGDITTDNSECIVNSSNEALDLTRGAVSKAILEKGGKTLANELKKLSKQMKKEHVVVSSAPGLPCKFIMHVVAVETSREWKQTVRRCLDIAERVPVSSIAFPALGTGLKTKADEIARIILDAVIEFEATQPQNLTDIKIVIFQQAMVAEFHRVFKGDTKKKSKWTFTGMLRNVTSKVTGRSKQQEHIYSTPKKKKTKQHSRNTITFLIVSLLESVNDQAVRKLEGIVDKEVHRKEFKDTIIMKLNDNQILEIKSIFSTYHLDFKLEKENGIIELSGIAANVIEASDKIHGILRDAVTLEQQKSAADLLTNLVQWNFIEITDTGQELIPYDKDLNYRIEAAFKSQAPDVTFTLEGKVYKLDFANMEEFPVDDTTDTVTVIRKDLVKKGVFEIPTTWTHMTGNIRVVALATTDAEYQDICQKFLTSAGGNYTISKVERIQNNTLWQQYQAKKKQLDDKNPPNTKNEQLLWHGTAPEAVDNINCHGFNRSYCGKNATVYGDGVYFAVNANYSCSNTYSRPDSTGMKRIYYCRVLTGEFTPGKSGMRVPPQKPGGSPTDLYDSVSGPSMFIIFHDTQAYPEYLISFK